MLRLSFWDKQTGSGYVLITPEHLANVVTSYCSIMNNNHIMVTLSPQKPVAYFPSFIRQEV